MSIASRGGKAFLSLLLALSLWGGAFPAQADELDDMQQAVDEAQVSLDEAEARMNQVSAEYEGLVAEVDRLQGEIDALAVEVMDAQAKMLEGRASLGNAVRYEYREGPLQAFVSLLLGSESMSDFLNNVTYLNRVMEYQDEQISAQEERRRVFQEASEKLSAQKDEQERALSELEEKRAEAEQLVSDAGAQLAGAQADQEARLAALQEQAARFAQESQEGGSAIAEDANTVDREDVVSDDTPVQPDPGDDAAGGGSSSGGSEPSGGSGSTEGGGSSAGWLTGVASAYGGSSDPYTPNPGITATGAICDDWSMGVAVPMSLPNYRSYFGRTVEISYNGMTVYAVVNDCGYMGGGSRALDLQPGVFKAFGFGDCYAWGLRTVSYRFL